MTWARERHATSIPVEWTCTDAIVVLVTNIGRSRLCFGMIDVVERRRVVSKSTNMYNCKIIVTRLLNPARLTQCLHQRHDDHLLMWTTQRRLLTQVYTASQRRQRISGCRHPPYRSHNNRFQRSRLFWMIDSCSKLFCSIKSTQVAPVPSH